METGGDEAMTRTRLLTIALAGLAAGTAAFLLFTRRGDRPTPLHPRTGPQDDPKPAPAGDTAETAGGRRNRNRVDEAIDESFPASDPPAY
jgi:hypothetical protein